MLVPARCFTDDFSRAVIKANDVLTSILKGCNKPGQSRRCDGFLAEIVTDKIADQTLKVIGIPDLD